jgi:hypothetical protein
MLEEPHLRCTAPAPSSVEAVFRSPLAQGRTSRRRVVHRERERYR